MQPENTVDLLAAYYREFAQYTISDRGVPWLVDGMIPVQRKIVYTTLNPDLPYTFNKKYNLKTSATIVGAVMGGYHPVGDASIYDSFTNMIQPYAVHLPLFTSQGNFGSIDGPITAHMRYTQVGGSPLYGHMFMLPDRDTPDAWGRNYNDTEDEPNFIDVALPYCLIRGAKGIAVSVAATIPAFNPGELIDTLLAHLEHGVPIDEAAREYIKGPDYPHGGEVVFSDDILTTGNGSLHLYPRIETSGRAIRAYQYPPQSIPDSLKTIIINCGKRGCDVTVDDDGSTIVVNVKDIENVPVVEGVVRSALSTTQGYDFTVIYGHAPVRVQGVIDFLQRFLWEKTEESRARLPDRLKALRPHCAPRKTVVLDKFKPLLAAVAAQQVVKQYQLHISSLGKLKLTEVDVQWKHTAASNDYTMFTQTVTSNTTIAFVKNGKRVNKTVRAAYAELSQGMVFPYNNNKAGVSYDCFVHPALLVQTTGGVYKNAIPNGNVIRTFAVNPYKDYVLVVWDGEYGIAYLLTNKKTITAPYKGNVRLVQVLDDLSHKVLRLTTRGTHSERQFTLRNLRLNEISGLPGGQGTAFSAIEVGY